MRAPWSLFILLSFCSVVSGQQMINTTTPFHQIGSSFFENNGVTWSLRGPNFFANGPAAAQPPFGNPDPNAGLRGGVGFVGGGIRGGLGFNFAQGSSRSISSTVPSITTMNGVPGNITSQTIRPFVTGVTPIVGDYAVPRYDQQMSQAVQRTQQAEFARRAATSNQARQKKALQYFERGQKAEEEGNKKMARANYRLALGSAEGLLRIEVLKRMQENGWAR